MIQKASEIADVGVLKTDTFIDELTGIWGLPRERIIEFYGAEKTGKSTASFHVIAAAQRQGLRCLLVDVEHSFTPNYAQDLGVNLKTLGIIRAELAEDYLDQTLDAVISDEWDLVVFDSIGSLSSRLSAEKRSGEKTIGVQASLMNDFVVKLAPKVSWKKMIFIGLTHTRADLMTGKVHTLGGKKWSEKKKLSLEFREKSGVLLKSGDNIVGKKIIVRVMKNAVGPTERKEVEVSLIFGQGFSASANLVDEAINKGVITKTGNSYFFAENKIGTISKLREWIKIPENADLIKEALRA